MTATRAPIAIATTLLFCATVAGLACADDVKIKVITPDNPPVTSQPGGQLIGPPAGVNPPPPPATPIGTTVGSGDGQVDFVLSTLKLTAEQTAKLKAVLDPIRQANEEAAKPYMALAAEYGKRRDEAFKRNPSEAATDPELKALLDKVRQAGTDRFERIARQRDKLLADISAVLTDEQAKAFKERLEEQDPKSPAYTRRIARMTLSMYAQMVKLTPEQEAKAVEVIQARNAESAKRQEAISTRYRELADRLAKDPKDADARKQMAELQDKMQETWQRESVQTRKAVEEVFTPEQREKVAEVNRKTAENYADVTVNTAMRSFDRARLTEDQKKKAAELADAARQALCKMDPYEWKVRNDLSKQLRTDIKALLTDEQRKLLPDESGWGAAVNPPPPPPKAD
ncbi:MAG: Spy/CpxP family protein refolding chaperone [Phycisphaerae bacterium]|nr:Spy/CpxP family protein refolding chaperone [Phycisphaerae bacterium]